MEIVFGDLSLGIVKDDVRLILSYNHGSLESFSKDGLEYLQRAVRPAFWRATSDNDRGNGFSKRSCLWMGADLFHTVDGFWADIDGVHLDREDLIAPANNSLLDSPLRQAKEAALTFRLHTATDPSATLLVTWRAKEGEEGLSCHFRYEGVEGLPELPVCGLRLLLPFTSTASSGTACRARSIRTGSGVPRRATGSMKGSRSAPTSNARSMACTWA